MDGRHAADVADEVQDLDMALAFPKPQAAAELLDEDSSAVGDAGEADDVDVGDIDAFVEDVDGSDDRRLASPEAHQAQLPLAAFELSVDALGALPLGYPAEQLRHPLGVLDRPAEHHRPWLAVVRHALISSSRIASSRSGRNNRAFRSWIVYCARWLGERSPSRCCR